MPLHLEPESTQTAGIYCDLKRLIQLRQVGRELKLFSKRSAASPLAGETASPFRGRGMEFEEVRHYQPGDDIRTIDWRVSARTGKPHTKLFREERERPVHLLIDQRNGMFFGSRRCFKSVLAAEIAAGLAWSALSGSDRIGGQVFGDYEQRDIRTKRSHHTVLHLLHAIHELNQSLPTTPNSTSKPLATQTLSLGQMLEECRRICRPGTALFIISDFNDFDELAERALSLLGRHLDISLIRILDPLESALPNLGDISISNGYERLQLSTSPALCSDFSARAEQDSERFLRGVRRAHAKRYEVSTTDDSLAFLRRHFSS